MREVEAPTVDPSGDEPHPAFGLIGASRASVGGTGSGAVVFDSDLQHNNVVIVRIKAAIRKRDLHHDWIHGRETYIEVAMSEAQWAAFVSSMNTGDGVPCTVRSRDGESIPSFPYDPRVSQAMEETRGAAHRVFDQIKEAMDAYDALDSKAPVRERREALRSLRSTITNAVPNVAFAGKALNDQVEDIVTAERRRELEATRG